MSHDVECGIEKIYVCHFYCQQTVSVIIIDMLLCCKYGNSVTIITEVTVASYRSHSVH